MMSNPRERGFSIGQGLFSFPHTTRFAPDVTAEFIHSGDTVTVPGFYAGGGVYKVRFLPMSAGDYTWRVTGAVSGEGREICESAGTHGPVRVLRIKSV